MAVLALAGFAQMAVASSYEAATTKACERAKACAMEQMADIPPEYRGMMQQGMDAMCTQLPQSGQIPDFSPSHPLYAPATACMNSIAAADCAVVMGGNASTPQCEAFQKEAERYDGSQ
ncbi:MAG: LA_2478/LA_2722/LA_4182 family protein [Oceanococcaceae bacterium]